MKVISLWQPFASLIFTGMKVHETRSFPFPKKMQGARIAIHATARLTPDSMISPDLDALCEFVFGPDWKLILPRSAILGTVVLKACRQTEDRDYRPMNEHPDFISGNWDHGRYAWELDEVQKHHMVTPAKGKQGWWEWEPEPLTFEIIEPKPRGR